MFKSAEQKTWKQARGELNRCVVIYIWSFKCNSFISNADANINQGGGGYVLVDIPIEATKFPEWSL